jgi:hypothetical protein
MDGRCGERIYLAQNLATDPAFITQFDKNFLVLQTSDLKKCTCSAQMLSPSLQLAAKTLKTHHIVKEK